MPSPKAGTPSQAPRPSPHEPRPTSRMWEPPLLQRIPLHSQFHFLDPALLFPTAPKLLLLALSLLSALATSLILLWLVTSGRDQDAAPCPGQGASTEDGAGEGRFLSGLESVAGGAPRHVIPRESRSHDSSIVSGERGDPISGTAALDIGVTGLGLGAATGARAGQSLDPSQTAQGLPAARHRQLRKKERMWRQTRWLLEATEEGSPSEEEHQGASDPSLKTRTRVGRLGQRRMEEDGVEGSSSSSEAAQSVRHSRHRKRKRHPHTAHEVVQRRPLNNFPSQTPSPSERPRVSGRGRLQRAGAGKEEGGMQARHQDEDMQENAREDVRQNEEGEDEESEGREGAERAEAAEGAAGAEGAEGAKGAKDAEGTASDEGAEVGMGTKRAQGSESTEGTRGDEDSKSSERSRAMEDTEGREGTKGAAVEVSSGSNQGEDEVGRQRGGSGTEDGEDEGKDGAEGPGNGAKNGVDVGPMHGAHLRLPRPSHGAGARSARGVRGAGSPGRGSHGSARGTMGTRGTRSTKDAPGGATGAEALESAHADGGAGAGETSAESSDEPTLGAHKFSLRESSAGAGAEAVAGAGTEQVEGLDFEEEEPVPDEDAMDDAMRAVEQQQGHRDRDPLEVLVRMGVGPTWMWNGSELAENFRWTLPSWLLVENEQIYKANVRRRKQSFEGLSMMQRILDPVYPCPMEERFGAWGEGGKWVCLLPHLTNRRTPPVVYSIGCLGETSFEYDVSQILGTKAHTYDHSINPPVQAAMASLGFLHYNSVGLGALEPHEHRSSAAAPLAYQLPGAGGGGEAQLKTLRQMMRENGHTFIDVFKIDCEGCELEFVQYLRRHTTRGTPLLGQILVEIHNLDTFPEYDLRLRLTLESLGYRLFHSEQNFYCSTCYELAFLHHSVLKTRREKGRGGWFS